MGGRRGWARGRAWVEGERMEEVETLQWATTLLRRWSSGLIRSPCLVLSPSLPLYLPPVPPPTSPIPSPFPGLAFYHSVFSPLAFLFHFISIPVLLSFFSLSLSVFDFHSPSAAQGMFSFQMRAKKSCDKVVCECVFVCVCVCALGLSVRELHRILISSRNLFRLKQLNKDAVYLIFFNASVENMSVGLMYVSFSSQCVGVRADVQHCPVNKNSHTSNNLVGQLWRNYSRCHVH